MESFQEVEEKLRGSIDSIRPGTGINETFWFIENKVHNSRRTLDSAFFPDLFCSLSRNFRIEAQPFPPCTLAEVSVFFPKENLLVVKKIMWSFKCSLELLVPVLLVITCSATKPGTSGPYHPGVCPNDLNLNLYVDAQSTCERECSEDQDCTASEKCCTNVCGLRSCVASRFPDDSTEEPESGDSPGAPSDCGGFECGQQGALCELWEGQPVCKCVDRCDSEPSFTCASDGLTYFNRCYLDAEACLQGISLAEVPCRFLLPGVDTASQEATSAPPDPEDTLVPPALLANPQHKVIHQGDTVSFNCNAAGHPDPEVMWKKQELENNGYKNDSDITQKPEILLADSTLMRPGRIYGSVVITSLAQLVVYSARLQDAGIYTCLAHNAAGILQADHTLSVLSETDEEEGGLGVVERASRPFSFADCRLGLNRGECRENQTDCRDLDQRQCGEQRVDWFFDATRSSCLPFLSRGCEGQNHFQTFQQCEAWCQRGEPNPCSLPPLRGPCGLQEPRWSYSPITHRCSAFLYGGCHGNSNSFRTEQDCQEHCVDPQHCPPCRPRGPLLEHLCRSDFALVGQLEEVVEQPGGAVARIHLERVLRDLKMGLEEFGAQTLELELPRIDWRCPCPSLGPALLQRRLLFAGQVKDGAAQLLSHNLVRPLSLRKLRKILAELEQNGCERTLKSKGI
ncbi:hypothetical protein DNTS_030227 [Danionella cerebrum]|uniref:Uncharacterized protein n=1 Tax=Danionella cerebrum TaxID=2873325 RepID=A0A553Q8D0_9TELE|nr:hypothetical protein DNTS_030227 [Danionella translucida]